MAPPGGVCGADYIGMAWPEEGSAKTGSALGVPARWLSIERVVYKYKPFCFCTRHAG